MQFDKVEEAAPLFKEVERLMSITDLPENKRNILSYQYGIYNQIRGKYDKAREYFRYCIDCAEKEESITREKDISTAYANMARMLVEAGDFFEAYKCIKKAINAEKEDELDSDQIVCYSTLAGICTELMQAGYGTTYIDEAIAAIKHAQPWSTLSKQRSRWVITILLISLISHSIMPDVCMRKEMIRFPKNTTISVSTFGIACPAVVPETYA